jgi:hypothetical protein
MISYINVAARNPQYIQTFTKRIKPSFMMSASYDVACLRTLPERTMFRMLRILPFALALAALSIFTACGGSSGAKFRVLQAIPNVPGGQGIDVYVDGKNVQTVQFATAPSGYLSVASGSRRVQLFLTGTTTSPYFDGNMTFASGTDYTVVATGSVTNNTVNATLLTDNNTTPTSGNSALRVIHASPSFQTPADIYLTTPNTQIAQPPPSISGVAYQAVSTYLTVPAASYAVLVTPAGFPGAVDIDMPDQSFAAGKIYTYVLVDVPGGGSLSGTLMVLNDN